IEVLCTQAGARRLEDRVLQITTSLGVRRAPVERRALTREIRSVRVQGHDVRVKIAVLPDGSLRVKPEFDDVARVAAATGQTVPQIGHEARCAAEQVDKEGVVPAASSALA
ncbi:MAG: LarC family nickel insertion protein, partial [Gemmatimonadota bacterium]|nr:LarC family nickel insertion protein [Gemmatimonadota bacterium]